MLPLMCLDHRLANVADARACVNAVRPGSWLTGSTVFETITKPYAYQRPSGSPPG